MTFKLLVCSGAVAFKLLELCGNPPVGCAASPPLHKGAEAWRGPCGFSFSNRFVPCFSFMRPLAAMKKRVNSFNCGKASRML